jgi:GntR family transcriptional regulator
MMSQIKINKIPLHLQVQQHLIKLIENGTYTPGEQLPSEVDLSAEFGVSRPTLREALLRLEQDGLIFRKHGVGTFISSRAPILESGLEVLESLEHQARRIGIHTEIVYLEVSERPARPEEIKMLLLPPEQPVEVLSVDRVIAVEGKSVAYLQDVMPQTVLRREDLSAEFSGSVLDILLQRGAPLPVMSRTEIIAEGARPSIASRMGIPQGTPLLKFVGQLYSYDEDVLDYSVSYFIPGHFKFHVMRRVGRC